MSAYASAKSSQLPKPKRILACVLCQQRKVKCDRKFPCANCIKSQVQCVPATLAQRRRRRRLPDRELLERLHKYENLLRQNNVTFEPFPKLPAEQQEPRNAESGDDSNEESTGLDVPTPATTVKSERNYNPRNIWHAMSQGFRDSNNDSDSSEDEVREIAIKTALNQSFENDDHLLFGSGRATVDLHTLHPPPVQIFRLWQIYLDNVNPLLKVTHTPSLQGRIIEAAGDLTNIDPALEALMFSIYCMSAFSLEAQDCQTLFNSSKEDLLTRYQFGCQQALSNCGFLRSSDRDCVTALYLYLISVRPTTIAQSLSSMLGVAIRIAQRMGIHSESALAKCTIFEAEMRRRLWWSLVFFDTRIGEITNSKNLTLDPTWDCSIPLNVNDSELRPEMKELPVIQGKSTEAFFVVVRSELGEFIRHSEFHLNFSNPALKPISKFFQDESCSEAGEIIKLQEMIEDQYLKYCDEENPIHHITAWTARAWIAKCRLLDHHSKYSISSVHPTQAQYDCATTYALRWLECDTKIMTSPFINKFIWMNQWYFPFPAYIQLVQDIRRRPASEQARQIWEVIDDNYQGWFSSHFSVESPLFHLFIKIILQAWEACETVLEQSEKTKSPPLIVSFIRNTLTQSTDTTQSKFMDTGIDDFTLSPSMGFVDQNVPFPMGSQDNYSMTGPRMFPGIPGTTLQNGQINHLDWTTFGGWTGWPGR